MKFLHKHSVTFVASAWLVILLLSGISSAATLYGLAQPGWENDPDPASPIYTVPSLHGTSVDYYFIYNAWSNSPHEASLGLGAFSTEVNIVLGEGSISCESAAQFQSGASEVSTSWAASDPSAATAWLLSLGNSEASREALRSHVEIWTGNLSDGMIPLESVNTDRFRIGDGSLRGTTNSVLTGDLTVIPEPSSAFLGAIGGFLLLRRRRAK